MAINLLAVMDFATPDDNPTAFPTYVACRSISASGAQTISVPTNSAYMRLAGTADFFVAYTLIGAASATSAVVGVNEDTGISNELIKTNGNATWRICASVSSLSVITPSTTAIVTVSFYSR